MGFFDFLKRKGNGANAVLVRTDGTAVPIHLAGFILGEDLGEPIDCTRTDMVMRNIPAWGRRTFGLDLVGYVDANGIPKGLEENVVIESISGYDHIAGDCVILRIDEKYNYLPLSPYDAKRICKHFNKT